LTGLILEQEPRSVELDQESNHQTQRVADMQVELEIVLERMERVVIEVGLELVEVDELLGRRVVGLGWVAVELQAPGVEEVALLLLPLV
jgi:hypothetical protein